MRVLQIHNRYRQFGGEDVAVESDAKLLRASGHEVIQHLVSNPASDLAAAGNLLVSAWNPSSYRRLKHAIDEIQPDVAHVHNTWYSLSASAVSALARANVPTVMTLHNYRLMCANGLLLRDGMPCTLCVGGNPIQGIRYRCYNNSTVASFAAATTIALNRIASVWNNVAVFIAMTEFARDLFAEGGLNPSRIIVRPNYATDPGARRLQPSRSHVVLLVGRVTAEKGADFIARVWESTETGNLTLRVIGDGPLRDQLERQYADIDFLGRVDTPRVAQEMLEARALLFPTLAYEGANPLTMVEALSAGLPVLASDLGSMSEVAAPQGSEWSRTARDFEDWRKGIRMLRDDSIVDAAGRAARATFEARFTADRALDSLEAAYQQALG